MIGVVILNYSTYADTIKLVEALQRQTLAGDLRIVVVDNASPNHSYRYLKPLEERFPHVDVLQTGENLGYARGNNFGLKYLEEHVKPEYVAVLNNDVELPDDCFERLAAKYRKLDNPCIVAPVQLNIQGQVAILGNLTTFTQDLLALSFLYRRLHKNKIKVTDNTSRQAMQVECIAGSFMFAGLEEFRSIGYFYPDTFLYVEERFVANFARKKGYHNYLLTDQTYVHRHGVTIKGHHNIYSTYKMLYDGWLKYTRICRKNGKMKALILKPLIGLSLLEVKLVDFIRRK